MPMFAAKFGFVARQSSLLGGKLGITNSISAYSIQGCSHHVRRERVSVWRRQKCPPCLFWISERSPTFQERQTHNSDFPALAPPTSNFLVRMSHANCRCFPRCSLRPGFPSISNRHRGWQNLIKILTLIGDSIYLLSESRPSRPL